jgi:hypothetical protein
MDTPNRISFLANLKTSPNLYLGGNTIIGNNTNNVYNDTGIFTNLPLVVNNTLTSQKGLNINSNLEKCSLTIDDNGNLITIGNITANGALNSSSLNINSNKFTISSTGLTTIQDDLIIGSNFRVTELTGSLNTTGTIYSGDSINAIGDLNIGNESVFFHVNANNGAAITSFPYNSYEFPSSSSNTTTTSVNNGGVDFTSNTSQYLATQTYVDQQLWNQTVRINTILGSDNSVLESFQNVYKLVTALEGSTTANALDGIVNETKEINTSVSDLAGSAFNTVLVNCSKSVWGNECAPLPIPYTLTQTINSESLDGWYFKNIVSTGSTTNKITWFLPSNGNMSISDFTNIYTNIFAVSSFSLPNITIYTKPKGNNTDIVPGVCNESITYSFSASIDNMYYCLYIGNNSPKNNFNITPIKCNLTTTLNALNSTINQNNNYDTNIINTNDEILYFCINTLNSVPQNSVEFILNSFNIQQNSQTGAKGTTQMLFQNSSVSSNYVFNTFFRKNTDFSNISSQNNVFLNAYNALYNSV